jgi:enoyl-CoA hydratase
MKNMNTLTFEIQGQIGIVTLNRPQIHNALSPEVYVEIIDVMQEIENSAIRAVIITGAGDKAFCAGADIEAMKNMTPYESRKFAQSGVAAFKAISHLSKPVIAAVNGLALGGGCELALACDLIYASSKARFGLPEITLGIFPGNGGTQRLTRLVGMVRAKELVFTGRMIKPEEALQMGMINQVVEPEELFNTVKKIAAGICEKGPISLHMAKVAINQTMEVPLGVGLEYETECFSSLFATQDQKEGMEAFLQKRKPQFKGQ